MSFAVGSSVAASGFGLGYVTGHLGAPDGGASHVVRAPNTPDSLKGGTFRTGELQPGPAMPVFEVGQEVASSAALAKSLPEPGTVILSKSLSNIHPGLCSTMCIRQFRRGNSHSAGDEEQII